MSRGAESRGAQKHGDVFAVASPPGLTLSMICADEIGAHVFRHRVADQLAGVWPIRAKALRSCGEAGARIRCADCNTFHVSPFRCAARACPTCAHIASAVTVEKVHNRTTLALEARGVAELWDGGGKERAKGWKLLTATMQTPGRAGDPARFRVPVLRESIRRTRRAWGPFWRSLPWGQLVPVRRDRIDKSTGEVLGTRRSLVTRRDTMFAMGVEVAPGGMVHLHAAVYAEFLPWQTLRAAWRASFGDDGNIKIQGMLSATAEDFRTSLREVLKYVSKGDASPRRAEWAANIETSMRQVRRVEMGGALRAVMRGTGPVDTRVTAKQVTYAAAKACDQCGGQKWAWAGIRAPEYVVRNGGFGVDNLEQMRRAVRRSAVLSEETRNELAVYYANDEAVFPADAD